MTSAEQWLHGRLDDGPPALRERILAALVSAGEGPGPPQVWRRAADEMLASAAHGPPSRETALTLLAADALITIAYEYVAAHTPERLADF